MSASWWRALLRSRTSEWPNFSRMTPWKIELTPLAPYTSILSQTARVLRDALVLPYEQMMPD